MNLHEKLEQERKMVIEIPWRLAEAVRNIAKTVSPQEFVLLAIVEKLQKDILIYRSAANNANEFLTQYEEECQAKKKQESTN